MALHAPTPPLPIPPPSALAALADSQVGLSAILLLLFPDDLALHRAVDRLRRLRYVHPPLAFDGLEARFQSHSLGDAEEHIVSVDAVLDEHGTPRPTIVCSCPGAKWPWCVHRLRFRLELADRALRDPIPLLLGLAEQRRSTPVAPPPPPPPLRRGATPEAPDEPPPPDEADRRDRPHPTPYQRQASPAARAEVQAALAAIEHDYPL